MDKTDVEMWLYKSQGFPASICYDAAQSAGWLKQRIGWLTTNGNNIL